jgi:hypothetical protein
LGAFPSLARSPTPGRAQKISQPGVDRTGRRSLY